MPAPILLDQRQILYADQANIYDLKAKVILATAVGQCQGDGQVETECYHLQYELPHQKPRSALECLKCSQISLDESSQIEELVEKLCNELHDEQNVSNYEQTESSPQDFGQSQMLVIFNSHPNGYDAEANCLAELLEHFQAILSCRIEGAISVFKLWGLTLRNNQVNASLDCILTIFQRLISEPTLRSVRDSFAVTPTDLEWKERMRTTKHHKLNPRFVHDLFAQTALKQPCALAVDAWDGKLTFEELHVLSSSLSTRLKSMGVGPEIVVPLLFEKTKWTIVTMLSVLKAGGAFLFLDPAHPATRLRSIIDRVRANFSITSAGLLSRLKPLERSLIAIEDLRDSVTAHQAQMSEIVLSPENAAFFLFTSGSTGEPKGVVTEHQALSSGIIQQAHGLGIDNQSRVMQGSMFSFAAAIVEMLFTVVVGGCVCIPTLTERFDDFPGAFNRMNATFGIFPPSYTAVTDPRGFKTLQVAVVGSEALSKKAVVEWLECFDVRHGYGTSEVNTVHAAASLNREDINLRSIGRGFAHNFWIVDALNYDRLVRERFAGEVLIESPAIARGYLGDEAATTKAFVSAPSWYLKMYGSVPYGTKFYKTGDLGKIIKGGEVEIHGRIDALQVKLRGQRIELGEVETCSLNVLPPDSHIFAELVLPVSQLRPHLALFCVVKGVQLIDIDGPDNFITPASVSDNLRQLMLAWKKVLAQGWEEFLPPFMRPSYLIPLRNIPRTTTGKIGRKLMRDWASQYTVQELRSFTTIPNDDHVMVALQGDKEQKLGRIWCTAFNISTQTVHANSDFFELGGDSLSAMRLVQAARDAGLQLRVADVLELHNFRDIARTASESLPVTEQQEIKHCQILDHVPSVSAAAQNLSISQSDVQYILPVTDSQSRAIRLGTGSEKSLLYHFVVSAHTDTGLKTTQLMSALQQLVHRHDSLRTAFFEYGREEIFQAVLNQAKVPVEVVEGEDCLDDSKLAIDRITSGDIYMNSIPTKFWIISPEAGQVSKFIVRLSHAQFDGVSLPALWRSLSLLYSNDILEPAPLFSEYMKAVLSADRDSAIAYFRDMFKDVPFTDVLHHERSGHHPQDRLLRKSFILPQLPFIPSVLFEAAWGYVLFRQTSNSAVVFDHIVSGRQLPIPDLRVMDVVGTCLNDVPVCVHVKPGMSVRQLLSQIQGQHIASAQHETLGFKTILQDCKPTHWPREVRMTSSVQFRGFDHVSEIDLGGTKCKIEMVERSMDLEDLTVLVEPARRKIAREYDIIFASSRETYPESDALRTFELFSQTVERFCSDLDSEV